jgi:hypothetical protein
MDKDTIAPRVALLLLLLHDGRKTRPAVLSDGMTLSRAVALLKNLLEHRCRGLVGLPSPSAAMLARRDRPAPPLQLVIHSSGVVHCDRLRASVAWRLHIVGRRVLDVALWVVLNGGGARAASSSAAAAAGAARVRGRRHDATASALSVLLRLPPAECCQSSGGGSAELGAVVPPRSRGDVDADVDAARPGRGPSPAALTIKPCPHVHVRCATGVPVNAPQQQQQHESSMTRDAPDDRAVGVPSEPACVRQQQPAATCATSAAAPAPCASPRPAALPLDLRHAIEGAGHRGALRHVAPAASADGPGGGHSAAMSRCSRTPARPVDLRVAIEGVALRQVAPSAASTDADGGGGGGGVRRPSLPAALRDAIEGAGARALRLRHVVVAPAAPVDGRAHGGGRATVGGGGGGGGGGGAPSTNAALAERLASRRQRVSNGQFSGREWPRSKLRRCSDSDARACVRLCARVCVKCRR